MPPYNSWLLKPVAAMTNSVWNVALAAVLLLRALTIHTPLAITGYGTRRHAGGLDLDQTAPLNNIVCVGITGDWNASWRQRRSQ